MAQLIYSTDYSSEPSWLLDADALLALDETLEDERKRIGGTCEIRLMLRGRKSTMAPTFAELKREAALVEELPTGCEVALESTVVRAKLHLTKSTR